MLSRSSAVPRELCNAGSSVSVFPISTSQASIVCFMCPRRCSHTPHVYISSSVYSTSSINNALSKTTTSYGAMKVPIPANLKKKKKKKKKKVWKSKESLWLSGSAPRHLSRWNMMLNMASEKCAIYHCIPIGGDDGGGGYSFCSTCRNTYANIHYLI